MQRFFFAFKLEKIDADGDGLPEGNKVILQQLWFAGREAVLNSKVIAEQACTGTWTVDDSGKLEIRLLKCYPEDNVAIGFYTGGPTNFCVTGLVQVIHHEPSVPKDMCPIPILQHAVAPSLARVYGTMIQVLAHLKEYQAMIVGGLPYTPWI